MADELDTTVLAFPSKQLPDTPAEIERETRFCPHINRIRIDEHTRTIACAECGAALEPFDFLAKSSKWLTSAWHNHAFVEREVRDRQQQVQVLKREIQRLKGQLKRLQQKAPDTVIDCRRPL